MAELQALSGKLQPVMLAHRQVLFESEDTVGFVYFPGSAVISLLGVMANGECVEVASVGSEGMIGMRVGLKRQTTALVRAVTQVSGEALMMRASDFKTELDHHQSLDHVVQEYADAFYSALVQSLGCSALHTAKIRCARWLLAMRDRAGTDEFPLTQECLAEALGVRRQRVATIIQAFQRAELIRYGRGKMVIRDHARLQRTACECYGRVKENYDEWLASFN